MFVLFNIQTMAMFIQAVICVESITEFFFQVKLEYN